MFALLLVAHGLGSIALEAGDAETARRYFQQELQLARELPNPRSEALSLSRLCRVALLEGDTDDAAACLDGCLRLANALGERTGIFVGLVGSAEVAVRRGEMARAARLLGAADALRDEIGYSRELWEREQRERVATALGNDAALVAANPEGRAMTLEEALAYALGEDA
jgi:ATP/maltotriose-dependent transcriptional regulator MalT